MCRWFDKAQKYEKTPHRSERSTLVGEHSGIHDYCSYTGLLPWTTRPEAQYSIPSPSIASFARQVPTLTLWTEIRPCLTLTCSLDPSTPIFRFLLRRISDLSTVFTIDGEIGQNTFVNHLTKLFKSDSLFHRNREQKTRKRPSSGFK